MQLNRQGVIMDDVAILVYTAIVVESGKQTRSVTEKTVYCSINDTSFSERKNLDDLNLKEVKKVTINYCHDAKNLTDIKIKGTEYTIIAKDRYKNSDQINLLIEERKTNGED